MKEKTVEKNYGNTIRICDYTHKANYKYENNTRLHFTFSKYIEKNTSKAQLLVVGFYQSIDGFFESEYRGIYTVLNDNEE